jgi:outer membrane lipoprotein-sorting protein
MGNKMIKKDYVLSGLAWSLLLNFSASQAIAETSEKKGHRIVEKSDSVHSGFKDYTADGQMILMDSGGNKSERILSIKVLEGSKNDGDKTMMTFSKPKDIKGTSLLTWSNKNKQDDQWLYLPALKRVKRIASSNKNGPFMGSEFSYEDLTPREINKYTYKYLKKGKCGKFKCHIVDALPTDKKGAYTRQTLHLDTKHLRIQKIEYYDRKKNLLKTMNFSGYKKYNKKHWAASKIIMENHQSKKSTVFNWSKYKYDNGFKKRQFDKNSLKRAR